MKDVTKTHKEFDVIEINKIKIRINPFPVGMYEAIMNDVIAKYEMPEMPQKEIDTAMGQKETVDIEEGDENYPQYQKEKEIIENKRNHEFAERTLKFVLNECIDVMNPTVMKNDIKRLSQYFEFPPGGKAREVKYISTYVLKTKAHYEKVITSALALSVVDDKEVAERLESFQD